jgi:transcriptional regulator with XRE-family HTH domain
MDTLIDINMQISPLGQQLKSERLRRGWTTDELARRSGVSRAMISKVERGESSPTALLLGRLSAAFGLTMSQMMVRADGRRGLTSSRALQPGWIDPETGFTRRNLTPDDGPTTPLELSWIELPAGQSVSYPAGAYAFIDDQQIAVIDGELTVEQGDQKYVLAAGDCLRLGPPADCTFSNRGRGSCRYVVAVLRSC